MKKYMLFIIFLIGIGNYTYSQKRKVALVVSFQGESKKYWFAYGLRGLTTGYEGEEDAIGYACGEFTKKNLVYITHIDKYFIYAQRRRLGGPSDSDARNYLAKNGFPFESHYLIDQIERDLEMHEAQAEQKITDENNRKQQLTNQQAQQPKQENDAREKLRQQQQQEKEQARIKNQQEQVRQEQVRNRQAQTDKETQRQQDSNQQQQQAVRDTQRQKEAQVAAQVNAVNKSSQTAINNLNKGAQDIKDMFSHSPEYYDNLRAEAQAKRNQQKQERIVKEEAEKVKTRELEEKYHREAEERSKIEEKEAIERQNNRVILLEQFPEGFLFLPNNISANRLYFFFYSYDKSSFAKNEIYICVSTPFYIEKHEDGSWPSRSSILSQITPLIPYTVCVINGYYSSYEEASKSQESFVYSFIKLKASINRIPIKEIKERSLRNEETDYLSIKKNPNEKDCRLFIKNFPDGKYTEEVKLLLVDNKTIKAFNLNLGVKTFKKLENDVDARVNYPLKDYSGDLCAIIKINTTSSGYIFDAGSTGINRIIQKEGQIWIYLPYGAKRITISHSQYGELKDYIFPIPIEKGTVYELY